MGTITSSPGLSSAVMAQKSASVAPSVTITLSGERRTPRSASQAQMASRSQAKPLLGG